jgi:hypothetical protein
MSVDLLASLRTNRTRLTKMDKLRVWLTYRCLQPDTRRICPVCGSTCKHRVYVHTSAPVVAVCKECGAAHMKRRAR